ncbi:MAG: DUF3180 domain-containing protein [Bifidobacterium sp.]|jgi:hypothetical protein|nr:DUF3180 domain-containing protein [Bifidobacterium sp.]MCI1864667.1 DUF3180 domain-containing protein [Bifidobacterium sp.]
MSARRTPWWYYLISIVLGLLCGIGLVAYDERSGLALIGAPLFVPALLALLGLVVLVLALQVHKYATTDPRKRTGTMNPLRAVYTLVLAKALGIAGAALAGWYAGQLLMSLSHADAPFYSKAILECAVTAGVCLADMIVGIISEWLCQLPPNNGPESPDMVKARKGRGLAQPAA